MTIPTAAQPVFAQVTGGFWPDDAQTCGVEGAFVFLGQSHLSTRDELQSQPVDTRPGPGYKGFV